jgi:cation:H+ antiporter
VTTALFFAASGILIVVAAELFTNAIEWAGYRLRLGSGATGSLLAALGTSLPELVVPVVALTTHSPSADSVAVGSVFGAPFLLLTLGAGFTGIAVLLRRGSRSLAVPPQQPRRDLGVFIAAFSVTFACVLLPNPARYAVGVCLVLAYVAYVIVTLRSGGPAGELPEPLHFVRWRPGEPRSAFIIVQLLVAIGLLVVGSQLFVQALHQAADALHVAPLVLALIVVPVATELPETINGVLWVRSRQDSLAFGNVAGSATFQACILGFIGVTFTSWQPGPAGVVSATLTLLTASALLALLWRGRVRGWLLALTVLPWLGYVAAQLITGGTLGG